MRMRRAGDAFARVVLLAALGGCAGVPTLDCRRGEQSVIHDRLYLGTRTPSGSVTATQWDGFLETVVTPRFPQGFTASRAAGQWRGEDGVSAREVTYVLELVHPDDAQSDAGVAEIAAAYKARFRQEAVLRVRASACQSL